MMISRPSPMYAAQKARAERYELLRRSKKVAKLAAVFIAFPFIADNLATTNTHYHEDAFFKGNVRTRLAITQEELKQLERKGAEVFTKTKQEIQVLRDKLSQPVEGAPTEIEIPDLTFDRSGAIANNKKKSTPEVNQNIRPTPKTKTYVAPEYYPTAEAAIVAKYPGFSKEVTAVTLSEGVFGLYAIGLSSGLILNWLSLSSINRRWRKIRAEAVLQIPKPSSVPYTSGTNNVFGDPNQYKRQFYPRA